MARNSRNNFRSADECRFQFSDSYGLGQSSNRGQAYQEYIEKKKLNNLVEALTTDWTDYTADSKPTYLWCKVLDEDNIVSTLRYDAKKDQFLDENDVVVSKFNYEHNLTWHKPVKKFAPVGKSN